MHAFTPYIDWITTQKDTLLERANRWALMNTYSLNTHGLDQFLAMLQIDFGTLGGEMQTLPLVSPVRMDQHGEFSLQPLGKALIIRKRPEAKIQVLLCGHMDTVYPSTEPFPIFPHPEKEIWTGPGLADMKGGLAILLTALEALERSPFVHSIGWEVLLTPDEEIGSPGSAILYQEAAPKFNFGLIFEPAFPDGSFASERKGSANYSLRIQGKEAHAGRDFSAGRNPLFPLADFIQQLESMQSADLTINIADVHSKGPVNIIPSTAVCKINLRSSLAETLQTASIQIKEIVGKLSKRDGIQASLIQDSFRNPKPFDSSTQLLFKAYESCAAVLNIPFNTRPTGGVCDGNILGNAGLPTLDTAGVVGGALHTHEEYMVVSSLVDRAQLTALFLFNLACGTFDTLMENKNG